MLYRVKINGKQIEVEVEKIGAGSPVPAAPAVPAVPQAAAPEAAPAASSSGADVSVTAPLNGSAFDICVTTGQSVAAGDVLIVIEAMKMENEIVAPQAGTVKQVLVSKGAAVETGDVLVVLN